MSQIGKDTENASISELSNLDELAKLYEKWPMELQEKLVNPSLFMRRQELSYVIANYEIFKLVQNVKGNIMYFGVYHGAGLMNFANLCSALEPFNHTREIIGFDTFSGYPEISEHDVTPGKSFGTVVKGGFSSESYELLQSLLEIYDKNRPLNHKTKVKLIKGDILQSLPDYLKKNPHTLISLIILTVNMYKPTKEAISLLWPRMSPGSIIVIHSLNEEVYPGATKAILDAIGDKFPIKTIPIAPNLAYIVKE